VSNKRQALWQSRSYPLQIDPFKRARFEPIAALAGIIRNGAAILSGYWMRMRAPTTRLRADLVRKTSRPTDVSRAVRADDEGWRISISPRRKQVILAEERTFCARSRTDRADWRMTPRVVI